MYRFRRPAFQIGVGSALRSISKEGSSIWIQGAENQGDSKNPKNKITEYTKAAGVSYTRFFDHRKITLVGRGDTAVLFTSIADIAGKHAMRLRFVTYVLTTLPPSELANHTFCVQGNRATMNELGQIFKAKVQHTDKIAGPMGESKTMLLFTDTGVGSTEWDTEKKAEKSGSEAAGSVNVLWSDHH
ncbi:hypothetical protein B0H14DRAFT_2632959 [Mycena olivaceomarginata]|nr:hypothetical protein B0H14DRAFT_2632959 [Mycena olivaceomarginata]